MLTNRPFIVTQSDLFDSTTLLLRGSPYSDIETLKGEYKSALIRRRHQTATNSMRCKAMLPNAALINALGQKIPMSYQSDKVFAQQSILAPWRPFDITFSVERRPVCR